MRIDWPAIIVVLIVTLLLALAWLSALALSGHLTAADNQSDHAILTVPMTKVATRVTVNAG